VQAAAVDAILAGDSLSRPAWAKSMEWIIGISLALFALIFGGQFTERWAITVPFAILISIIFSSWIAFSQFHFLFDPIIPLTLGGTTAATVAALRFSDTARARAHIRRAFDRYLSPELVERIVRDPSKLELGGEERDMTVLFCDVRGFSALSERMQPQDIIQFLIGLLTPMTDILLGGRATIDKYVGDAIIAFWNAPLDDPSHAKNAADTALAMIARLTELNREMPNQSRYPWPGKVQIGIGLNSGPVCVGNMGSEHRLNYSMIGDTVNLASRIEGLTKYYGIEIALGNEIASRLDQYAIIEIDRVRVIGRLGAESIHALVGDPKIASSEPFHMTKNLINTMRAAYLGRNWDKSDDLLDLLIDHSGARMFDKLISIYRDRIARFRELPPPLDWDGVYDAQEK